MSFLALTEFRGRSSVSYTRNNFRTCTGMYVGGLCWVRNNPAKFPQHSLRAHPKHLLRLFLASKVILFSKVIFKSAQKIPFKTRLLEKLPLKQGLNHLSRLCLASEVIFSLARLFLKESLKRFFGQRLRKFKISLRD